MAHSHELDTAWFSSVSAIVMVAPSTRRIGRFHACHRFGVPAPIIQRLALRTGRDIASNCQILTKGADAISANVIADGFEAQNGVMVGG
ncbi:hypothetical protein Thi970DRAFT_00915 [Thiorhodovibrio frisius]|uniref:Uncharacterized protein n=1 Tax=Thiorhodovibrio frisius TaxID=631362 RepID=H8YXT3_9GAMM|nr:hypothetical protein Thi970DRAFT_00915 [Thiorhodovibrio frisius]WPL23665.1 hypothetical protein Thiofri_03865 [Thiorhodovibrio frisius]